MTGPTAGTHSWRPRCPWRWPRWQSGRRPARRIPRTGRPGCARRCRPGRVVRPPAGRLAMRATLVTVVSLHGSKTGPLAGLLAAIQATAARCLGTAFAPYSPEQVHGTLIVLSGYRDETGEVINEHYLGLRGERHAMDFGHVQRLVLGQLAEP